MHDNDESSSKKSLVIKVGIVGDSQIGKTSLMVKYVQGQFNEEYIQTLGVNFMERPLALRDSKITFAIWDLGGQREFMNMLPVVCNDAKTILYLFDLTRKFTLNSIKEWYRQVRSHNKVADAFLIGTKYDEFVHKPFEEQREITLQARKYAKAMKAPLIFTSAKLSINVKKIFVLVLSRLANLKCTLQQITNIGEPVFEFDTK